MEGFFWEDFGEDCFGSNSLSTLELTCLSRFWFLSRFCLNGEEEEEGQEFRSTEVRRKLIALKKNKTLFCVQKV